jgi:uncharacterized protein (DUF924 family)
MSWRCAQSIGGKQKGAQKWLEKQGADRDFVSRFNHLYASASVARNVDADWTTGARAHHGKA